LYLSGVAMRELTPNELDKVFGGFGLREVQTDVETVVVPGTRPSRSRGFTQNWIVIECNGNCFDRAISALEAAGQQAIEFVCDHELEIAGIATIAGEAVGRQVGSVIGAVGGRVIGTVGGAAAGAASAGPPGAAVGAVVIGGAGQIAGQRVGGQFGQNSGGTIAGLGTGIVLRVAC
jgi:hypothetical protein